MKTKNLLLLFVLTSLATFSQYYIYPDDIYYDKNDEKKEMTRKKNTQKSEILISEPEIETYKEGVIIYKNEDGTGDTIYIYNESEFYLKELERQENNTKLPPN